VILSFISKYMITWSVVRYINVCCKVSWTRKPIMNIADRFKHLIDQYSPTLSQIAGAEKNVNTIKATLRANLDVHSIIEIGSHARGTSIRYVSDVDLLCVLRRESVRWGKEYVSPETLLGRVKAVLTERLPNSGIRRDGSCIVASLQNLKVDVVPAFYSHQHRVNWPVYKIPGADGEWIETSPAYQAQFILDRNQAYGGKLRGLSILAKIWRHCRTPAIDLSSFHIEMLLAQFNVAGVGKSYPVAFCDLLELLAARDCKALRDPTGTHGPVRAAKSSTERDRTLRAVIHSAKHARLAVTAGSMLGKVEEARRQWRIVFNGVVTL
jgi:predicted nucleotidyltransferase